MINAAIFAGRMQSPLNTLVTINVDHARLIGAGGKFAVGHTADNVKTFMELLRKWHQQRGLTFCAIWTRERADKATNQNRQAGEHLHLMHHLPPAHREAYLPQLATWTGVNLQRRVQSSQNGEIARSECSTLQVEVCTKGGHTAPRTAAYLGKDEPNRLNLYRSTRPNPDKPCKRGRMAGTGGRIEGKRYGISTAIHTKAQSLAGFTPHSVSELARIVYRS